MKTTNLNDLAKQAHATAVANGFHRNVADVNFGEQLMLVVTEVAEAMEEYRKGGGLVKNAYLELSVAGTAKVVPPPGWGQKVYAGIGDNYTVMVEQLYECPFVSLGKSKHLMVCSRTGVSSANDCGGTDRVRGEIERKLTVEELVKYYGYKAKPVGIPSELADIIIRVLDIAAMCGIDIQQAVENKMKYNATRPYRHGGKVV